MKISYKNFKCHNYFVFYTSAFSFIKNVVFRLIFYIQYIQNQALFASDFNCKIRSKPHKFCKFFIKVGKSGDFFQKIPFYPLKVSQSGGII